MHACIDVLKSEYWAQAWAEHRQKSGFCHDGGDTIEFWNKRAPQFRRNTTGEAGAGRVTEVLGWLAARGVHPQGLNVLDVGAGPGSFAVPFAQAGATVTALDASPVMIELLHEEMQAAGHTKTDYTALTDEWEALSPAERGWEGAFDLVFVSMCPALADIDALNKALACSRAYLYINAFAGKRESHALYQIWRMLHDGEPPDTPDDAFFMTNLLHTLGYDFELTIYSSSYVEEMTVEEAGPLLTRSLSRWKPDCGPEQLDTAVQNYIASNSVNGVVHNQVDNRHGRFLVHRLADSGTSSP